jgi:hypothetical protein
MGNSKKWVFSKGNYVDGSYRESKYYIIEEHSDTKYSLHNDTGVILDNIPTYEEIVEKLYELDGGFRPYES